MSETEPTPTRGGYAERERERERRRQLTGNKEEKMVPGAVLLAMRKILFIAKYARNRPFGYAVRPRLSPVQGNIKQAEGSQGKI